MVQRMFHTPEGVRDVYNGECERKQFLQEKLHRMVHRYGYQDIETPTFEFFDVFSREVGTTPSKDLYKFFDREGNTLVLRPDFTPSVARAAAKYFLEDGMPVRLCYQGSTFINNSSYQGRLKESTEMGVELMGDASIDADAEILTLMVDLLRETGLSEFQISVGQVDFFKSLIEEAGMNEETVARLRELISNKNHFGVEELISEQKLSRELEHAFLRLPHMFGSVEIMEEAKNLTNNKEARAAIERLEKIYEILKLYGVEKYISFDLGMLSKYKYYTGIIFQGYTYGSGEPLVKGGRYNSLLEHFLRPSPAIGFALVMEQVMNALERQNIEIPVSSQKTMIVYPEYLRSTAVRLAKKDRSRGMKMACMVQDKDKTPEDYSVYAKKQGFDSVVYVESEHAASTVDLNTDSVKKVDL
ncbi:ATP phosphoribosyltransferase regulatory subunit [Ruminococcus sp. OA3]|uniref:ATP phosphoribosyltransferase regulatory subunit n=1 Tax=Ruminococcus sp. OA3 TaxID=2914164 RepID=UPI001F05E817|nr:ATP phosphoribosyltransferase regulatory subunit [Ruminococcus sp. OA3]MCH1983535.1 ATP phosphoribosyltransferase regulatory subunit [Ruminococcus sp. OA3]